MPAFRTFPDFAAAAAAVLQFRSRLDVWLVTWAEGDDGVVLDARDRGYGVAPGRASHRTAGRPLYCGYPHRLRVRPMSPPGSPSAYDPRETRPFEYPGESVFREGSTVCGYLLQRRLGEGGMGTVFAAVDAALGRKVAVKVMRREVLDDPTRRGRFLREARLTAALEHDNVVRVYQVGEADGQPFLVMELLAGVPLADRLAAGGGRPAVADALRIARDVARGLAAAHARGLVHRDVSPGNVWVDPAGRAKLLDFGLAHDPDPDAARLTTPGTVMGTPGFMSPEQAGGEPVDARADLFGLGCILYVLVTGVEPFTGGNTVEKLVAVRTRHPPPPWAANPDLPEPVGRLIAELLSKSPDDRPRTAAEVAERLSGLLADLPGPAASTPQPATSAPAATRRPLLTHAATAAVSAAATAGLFYLLLSLGLLR